ncbi:MAG: hypothetical protein DMD86_02650 [Candidatus Rokuibacteriota bacterium]|nr:MAG: hypothetical protein DMD86_02650 [Candidatus Rokubacteria bacterium]
MSIGFAFGECLRLPERLDARGGPGPSAGRLPAGLRHPLARTQLLHWEPQDVRVQLISQGDGGPSSLLLLFLVAR